MADGDGTAIDVVLLGVDAKLVAAVEALAGESFVQLPQVDVIDLEARALQKARHGEDRADAHFFRFAAGNRETAEGAERLQAALFGFLGFHDHHGGSAVGELGCITGSDVLAFLDLLAALEHRLQALERFQRRARTVALVAIDKVVDDRLFAGLLVDLLHLGLHRDDLVLEDAGFLRVGDALLAAQRVFVLRFAGDAIALGHDFGSLEHRHPELRLGAHQMLFGDVVEVHAAKLHEGDRLHARADGNRDAFIDHAARGHGDRLQAGGAEAVHRGTGGRHRAACPDGGGAGDVLARGAFRLAAAHDHVFDFARLNARALDGMLDGMAAHCGAMGDVEAAAAGLGQAGAGGGHDHCFSAHEGSPETEFC